MKRNDSFRDAAAVASHFPKYLEKRVAEESFVHEAVQYAMWLPLAAGAKHIGWNGVAYLFLTWFILGELALIYMKLIPKKLRVLKWYHVLLGAAVAGVHWSAELALDENSYWRYLTLYVIGGIGVMAVALPFVPRKFTRGAPEFLVQLGFIASRGKPEKTEEKKEEKKEK
jgi:hypothetical protein